MTIGKLILIIILGMPYIILSVYNIKTIIKHKDISYNFTTYLWFFLSSIIILTMLTGIIILSILKYWNTPL